MIIRRRGNNKKDKVVKDNEGKEGGSIGRKIRSRGRVIRRLLEKQSGMSVERNMVDGKGEEEEEENEGEESGGEKEVEEEDKEYGEEENIILVDVDGEETRGEESCVVDESYEDENRKVRKGRRDNELMKLHRRMGHINVFDVRRMIVENIIGGVPIRVAKMKDLKCEVCIRAKQRRRKWGRGLRWRERRRSW